MVIRMCYTNNKLIVRHILNLILRRPEQHPKQTAPLCGIFASPQGTALSFHQGFHRAAWALFAELVCLWVGGVGENMWSVWELGTEHGYIAVQTPARGEWALESLWSLQLQLYIFVHSAFFSGILASQHQMSSLPGLQLNFPTDSQYRCGLLVS